MKEDNAFATFSYSYSYIKLKRSIQNIINHTKLNTSWWFQYGVRKVEQDNAKTLCDSGKRMTVSGYPQLYDIDI